MKSDGHGSVEVTLLAWELELVVPVRKKALGELEAVELDEVVPGMLGEPSSEGEPVGVALIDAAAVTVAVLLRLRVRVLVAVALPVLDVFVVTSAQLQENGIGMEATLAGSWNVEMTARSAAINVTTAPLRRYDHEMP